MLPNNNPESLSAFNHLADTGECIFELSPNESRLFPVALELLSTLPYEECCHSFVDEIACGR